MDRLDVYRRGEAPEAKFNKLWPLYGSGLKNMGINHKPIKVPMPSYGPDELLVRHDVCGLCFSDIKVIRLGQEHPRIYRKMKGDPVILGHEVCMTVVGVGEKLRNQYSPGDRFIIQADIFVNGVGYAYGYEIQGGLSQYNVIDQRILNGDHGNYLIPIKHETGYAESAIVEPWACVIAAYRLKYRTTIKNGGTMWIIGDGEDKGYSLSRGFDAQSHPARLIITNLIGNFRDWLEIAANKLSIEVINWGSIKDLPKTPESFQLVDDIILLNPDAELVEKISPHLAKYGILAFIKDEPFSRKLQIDVGRIHYNRWVYIGGSSKNIAHVYADTPVRSTMKSGGKAWFVGAGGPMGRMHVQRAIEIEGGPSTIVCSDISDHRLTDLCISYAEEAKAKGIEFICLNPMEKEAFAEAMAELKALGFDDIVVLAPAPAVISDSAKYLAPKGVMNIFAGVARGTFAELDLNDVLQKDVRTIGHSASAIEDMIHMLDHVETGKLSTNRSVAAIGSLSAAREGMKALIDAKFPGKVVIYPQVKKFPLTAVPDLRDILPEVYAKLKDGREWTKEAEATFLRLMLE